MSTTLQAPTPPAGGPRSRRHTARSIAGILLVVLVAVAIVVATRPSYQATPVASPLEGQAAPSISGTTLTGQHVSLADYRGRYVYVNFFASWCPPCQAEEPNLVAFDFQQQRAGGGAALLSVVFNDTDAGAKRFVATMGADWPALSDHDGTIANAYGVGSPPETFLIDPRGTVVGRLDGPATTAQLTATLARARQADG